jgi:hypothetical protein
VSRLRSLWSALVPEQRGAALAAAGLVLTFLLPWYQKSYVPRGTGRFVNDSLLALQVFGWVEAAVFLVAAAVLAMLYARAEGRGFHLPGGDGTVVLAAGVWCCLLLAYRMFDRPDLLERGVGAATVNLQWGLFVALAAAVALALAGARLRAIDAPQPGADPGDDDPTRVVPEEQPTRVAGDRPGARRAPPGA